MNSLNHQIYPPARNLCIEEPAVTSSDGDDVSLQGPGMTKDLTIESGKLNPNLLKPIKFVPFGTMKY